MSIDYPITDIKKQILEQRMVSCGLKESDLQETFIKSSGPGGQNTNKTATCVHLKHIPTSLEVKMMKSRSQALNRYYARKRMCELMENQQLGSESANNIIAQKIRKQKLRRKRRTSS